MLYLRQEDSLIIFESLNSLVNFSKKRKSINEIINIGFHSIVVKIYPSEIHQIRFLEDLVAAWNGIEWIILTMSVIDLPKRKGLFNYHYVDNADLQVCKKNLYLNFDLDKSANTYPHMENLYLLDSSLVHVSFNNIDDVIINYSKFLSNVSKNNNLYFDWEIIPTIILKNHPCMTYRSFQGGCHIKKSRYPRIITIDGDSAVFPYGLKSHIYRIGSISSRVGLNEVLIQGNYDKFYILNNEIYFNYIEKWPFSTFPLGGFYRAFDK